MKIKRKRFFTNHSKSSAMVISLAVHAILAVVAVSFVAVTVIQKGDQNFEAKQVIRPRMPPKKLQVPVKITKKQRRPKLRQRIVVKHQINRNMPDIKMPEISGIKAGLGATGGTGLGDAGSIGFNMPEINVFGVRSKGKKIFIALDSDAYIMREVMTVIYMADGGHVSRAVNDYQLDDLSRWLPGARPGDLAATRLNPLVYSELKRQSWSWSRPT